MIPRKEFMDVLRLHAADDASAHHQNPANDILGPKRFPQQ
eukprot:CAMPEP_0119558356 /NCGR_PEP_ID=MMETSP1352-20130426/10713_1 /TAXON_ID=265584 /ORGANISM="Stauroneis constricta, Strain CCMP1120" /LENGTH=39 /DNA_ID= /DNA_START= /DNA_END= /DNA_ORIENTATION=